MKKACLVTGYVPHLNGNRIFRGDKVTNNHQSNEHFLGLKEAFLKKGYDLSTDDINSPFDSEIVIFFGLPNGTPLPNHPCMHLIRFESNIVAPSEWDTEVLKPFRSIFTWDDSLIDNKTYFKINFPIRIPEYIRLGLDHKKKFCALIAGNKRNSFPNELYSKRVDTIRWFEAYHPELFDLFGTGWDSGFLEPIVGFVPPSIHRWLRLPTRRKPFPSYRGAIESKIEVLERYRFNICYENAYGLPGYMTEKLFDSFFAGCIPIYWGASNILAHVPDGCFIDRRNFKDHRALFSFLIRMTDTEYLKYQKRIIEYVHSEAILEFTGDFFSSQILKGVFK